MTFSIWWLSSNKMTFCVKVSNGRVIDAAPIARRFIGQPFGNLKKWVRRQGGYRAKKVKEGTFK